MAYDRGRKKSGISGHAAAGSSRGMRIFKAVLIVLFCLAGIVLSKASGQAGTCAAERLRAVRQEKTDTEGLSGADIAGEVDYSGVNEALQDTEFAFEEAVLDMADGEGDGGFQVEGAVKTLWNAVTEELNEKKDLFRSIIGAGAAAAVFSLIAGSFQNGQVAQTGFFICYLALFGVLTGAFFAASAVVTDTVLRLLDFMRALIPVYVTVLAVSGGTAAGAVFYQGTLFLISFADMILLHLILPAVNIYLVLALANNLNGEPLLSKMTGLIRDAVKLGLKLLLAVVIGFGGLKSLIVPAADAVKKSVLLKAAGALPGVGGILEGVSQTVLGAAALLKNAVGAAGVIAICVICAVPVVKVFLSVVICKAGSAIIEPVSDSRIVGAVSACAGACTLLLNVLLTAAGLFLIAVTIAALAVKPP